MRCVLRELRDEDLTVLFEQWADPVCRAHGCLHGVLARSDRQSPPALPCRATVSRAFVPPPTVVRQSHSSGVAASGTRGAGWLTLGTTSDGNVGRFRP